MRIALVVALVFASAAAQDTEVRQGKGGDSIDYSGGTAGSGPSTGGGPTGGGGGEPGYYVGRPTLRDHDGEPCVAIEYHRYDTPAEARNAALADELVWVRMAQDYEPCPRTPTDAGPAGPSAASEAEAFWGSVPLPRPVPRIAPGWAVTGRRSYLETGSRPTARFTRSTPRGELVIEATGPYYVDWGDGTTSGPHHEAGAPWPDGRITHAYERVGTYDVVVTQRWTATWTLGDEFGRLGGLRTTAAIEDFPAEELQAVRNR